MKKTVFKLIDRTLVLATEIENTINTVTIKSPLCVTQILNHQTGQPEIMLIPMDLIFGEVDSDKDFVTLKKEHIMYEKPLADFPSYENAYSMQTTGVQTIKKSGIIT